MKKIKLKSEEEIKRIREAGQILSKIFKIISKIQMEGLTTLYIDSFIEDLIHKSNAEPSFQTVKDYNHASCISINNEVVHGIPSINKTIHQGDIVKIDIGIVKNSYFADACYTFPIEPISPIARRLINVAKESLKKAIEVSKPGNRIGDIGAIIQKYVEKNGFSVVKDFTGHGVGFAVHESPSIPHFGVNGKGPLLEEGMVLAIEPMVNEGKYNIKILDDGWTTITTDGKLSAQFEHTIAITKDGPIILTK